ncbi:MAG: NUMOD4 motif-containing HNH endonuclease [Sediminibacterium sp.]|jgi:hypothetical protein|uniref:NUMOD4 motif-containing HNH endonuclease n=1 Tax=unclassified Sediminibacterium TaxID=2635961 RepID=UPI001D527B6D|nr:MULTISPECIES: NUMOD4 motif-containing HNH endonuclease [unclassified Sediminibacterium]MBW0161809.1 NUMOD4 motif-containing HNH endonuclease [Sediminibacterium sp.]MBW0165014.1 NUMOD4 motif-containing HNH endonuclease [Sediminibacterium sp.]
MDENTWYPVRGYEGLYEINKEGVVISLHGRNRRHIMPQRIDRAGYYTVRLSNKGKDSTVYVHRLLAYAFIKNIENKPFVNHINGNKLDNTISNLEWVTHSENMKHAYKLGLVKKISCKKVINLCTGEVFNSIREAAAFHNMNYNTFKNMLYGHNKNNTCLSIAA